jgi:hypothetical protein
MIRICRAAAQGGLADLHERIILAPGGGEGGNLRILA